jgi:hypothetical protein
VETARQTLIKSEQQGQDLPDISISKTENFMLYRAQNADLQSFTKRVNHPGQVMCSILLLVENFSYTMFQTRFFCLISYGCGFFLFKQFLIHWKG